MTTSDRTLIASVILVWGIGVGQVIYMYTEYLTRPVSQWRMKK